MATTAPTVLPTMTTNVPPTVISYSLVPTMTAQGVSPLEFRPHADSFPLPGFENYFLNTSAPNPPPPVPTLVPDYPFSAQTLSLTYHLLSPIYHFPTYHLLA